MVMTSHRHGGSQIQTSGTRILQLEANFGGTVSPRPVPPPKKSHNGEGGDGADKNSACAKPGTYMVERE